MFKKKNYNHLNESTPQLFFQDKLSNLTSDPQLRYINIGIVNVVEPTEVVSDFDTQTVRKLQNHPKYLLLDNLTKDMISFDIHDLYHSYIRHNINHINTDYGLFKLSDKTISDIIRIIKKQR